MPIIFILIGATHMGRRDADPYKCDNHKSSIILEFVGF